MGVKHPETPTGFGLGLTTDIHGYRSQEDALYPQEEERPEQEERTDTVGFEVASRLGLNNFDQVEPGVFADRPRVPDSE